LSSRYLIPFDLRVTNSAQLVILNTGVSIDFQFPPEMTQDSRRVEWSTKVYYGGDPLAIYNGNSARQMTLKIDYIIETANGGGGGLWTINKIKRNINELKGYFTGAAVGQGGTLMAIFKYPKITGDKPMSVRIGSVNVDYSGPHIGGQNDGSGFEAYPLKSTVTLDIATATLGPDTAENQTETYWDGIHPFPSRADLWY